MKRTVISIFLLTLISCANIYSPTGIKGKDALKEIDALNNTLSLPSISLILSASFSSSSSSSSSEICSTDGIPSVSPLGSSTSTSNFSIPSDLNTVIDLSAPGGTVYFRSQPVGSTSSGFFFIQATSLKTSTITTAGSCAYSINTANCGTTDLSGISYSTTVSFAVANNCLAVRCTTPALVRIRQGNSTITSFDSTTLLLSLVGPEIFSSASGIEEDTYYTRDSFEKCKEDLVSIGLLQVADVSASLQRLSTPLSCNLPLCSAGPTLSSAGYNLLQGDACKLEPVSFIGL